jgi:hypothetical protein
VLLYERLRPAMHPQRALKLWMVLRMYGTEKLRALIRRHCTMAAWVADQVMVLEGGQEAGLGSFVNQGWWSSSTMGTGGPVALAMAAGPGVRMRLVMPCERTALLLDLTP